MCPVMGLPGHIVILFLVSMVLQWLASFFQLDVYEIYLWGWVEFKCAHSHFYIISPLNVCASIYYLLKIQPAGCYKHGTLLAVFTHRYGCCRNSLAGSGPGFQELLCFTKQGSLFIQICVCMCVCSVTQSCLALSSPTGSSPPVLLLMVFSRQEPWSELPFLSPGDLPNLGTEVASLESPPLQWILPVCHLGSPSTPINPYNNCLLPFAWGHCVRTTSIWGRSSCCSHLQRKESEGQRDDSHPLS